MRISKVKTNQDIVPASQTRPKLATTRPEPVDEPLPGVVESRYAAQLADDYDAIRVKQIEFDAVEKELKPRLIEAMKVAGKKNFGTMHGRVSFLPETEGKEVPDEDAAIALLAKHGIPQPPTLEVWLAQHRDEDGKPLQMPMKTKEGQPDRIKFELNK